MTTRKPATVQEFVDDMIDVWHTSDPEINLIEFLGWSSDEYAAFVERGVIPQKTMVEFDRRSA